MGSFYVDERNSRKNSKAAKIAESNMKIAEKIKKSPIKFKSSKIACHFL